MRFPVPTEIHPKCRDWLNRSAAHVATLSPKQRAAWLQEWIPAAREFPLDEGVSAADLQLVVTTLLGWHEEPAREAA